MDINCYSLQWNRPFVNYHFVRRKVSLITKGSESICPVKDQFGKETTEVGAEYKFTLQFVNNKAVPDNLGFAYSYNEYTKCVPYPKNSSTTIPNPWRADAEFFKTIEEYKQTEAFRKRVFDLRMDQANKFMTPMDRAVEVWRGVASLHQYVHSL